MRFPHRDEVQRLRDRYPAGTRVRLNCMDDINAPAPGTEGTVTRVDDIGTIHVAGDNGSMLGVAYGVDSCSKL